MNVLMSLVVQTACTALIHWFEKWWLRVSKVLRDVIAWSSYDQLIFSAFNGKINHRQKIILLYRSKKGVISIDFYRKRKLCERDKVNKVVCSADVPVVKVKALFRSCLPQEMRMKQSIFREFKSGKDMKLFFFF